MKKSGLRGMIMLPAVFVLAFSVAAFGADKLIVKDSAGTNTVFKVEDTGAITAPGLYYDPVNYKLGIGIATPGYAMHTRSTSQLVTERYSNDTYSAGFIYRKGRGTPSAPQPALAGDAAGNIQALVWDGTAFRQVANLQMLSQTMGSGWASGAINFLTTNSSGVAGNIRLRVDADGFIGIGSSTAPTAQLDIQNAASTSGIRLRSSNTPASATAACNQGDISWDTNNVYVCVATNNWKKATLSTW